MHMLSAVLKDILGEAMFQLFPSDIFSAMILGAILQVATESTHGQIKGPLAPRMGPIIDALAGFLAQADPILTPMSDVQLCHYVIHVSNTATRRAV